MNDEGIYKYCVIFLSIFPKIHINYSTVESQWRRITVKRKYYFNLTDDEEEKKRVMETNVVNRFIFIKNWKARILLWISSNCAKACVTWAKDRCPNWKSQLGKNLFLYLVTVLVGSHAKYKNAPHRISYAYTYWIKFEKNSPTPVPLTDYIQRGPDKT